MATGPEHDPNYKKLSSRLKRARDRFNNSFIGCYKEAYLGMFSRDDCTDRDASIKGNGFLTATASIPFMVMGLAFGINDEVVTTTPPSVDAAAQFEAELDENGHIFLSADEGQTGYALFRYEDSFRLYALDDEDRLRYIEDTDNAWHQARMIYDDYTNLSGVLTDNTALNAPNWEVYSLGDVSQYVMTEGDTPELVRYFDDIQEYNPDGISRLDEYGSIQSIWFEAASYFQEAQNPISEAEITVRAGEYTMTTEIVPDHFDQTVFGLSAMAFLFGNALLAYGCVAPARRKYEKKKQQNQKPKV